jgi:hypothetical protein
VLQPRPGHPDHLDSHQQQVLLPFAVPLEGGAGPVRLEDVEFDREPLLGPVAVELEPVLDVVGVGPRQAGGDDEFQEPLLPDSSG